MGAFRRAWIGAVSEVSWRLPGWPVRLLTAFSQAERGSFYDMLAAAEATDKPDLRRKYFEHALQESNHHALFKERIAALGGGKTRAERAAEEAGYLNDSGIVGGVTLYERLGELDFLAFVHVAEAQALEQFHVYCDRELPDPDTIHMLRTIMPDEKFHLTYTLRELKRRAKQGEEREVKWALFKVRWRRAWEAWLRFARDFGHFMSTLWLSLIYGLLVPPFRLAARLETGGWQSPRADKRPLVARARSQG